MLSNCPHCGSDEPIEYIVTRRVAVYQFYTQGAEDSEIISQASPKTGTCPDCKKRVKLSEMEFTNRPKHFDIRP